jgi:SAM-dependent methyltransferase
MSERPHVSSLGAASAPPPAPGEYVLGANAVEFARLTLQQEVWGHVTEAFLDRIGVPVGGRVLDLGCGPGLLVESFRRRVGPAGRVDALDESAVWMAHLKQVAAERRWTNVRLVESHIEDAPLEVGVYDVIFARWVLAFLPNAAKRIGCLTTALRAGGVLAIQDYNHEGISLFPESEGFRAVVRATRALWAKGGGDMFLAGRLPGHFRAAGLEPLPLATTVLAGGPTSGVFRWADAFFPPHSENMVRAGLLTAAERDLFLSEWAARKANPDALFFSPIVVDSAARRLA